MNLNILIILPVLTAIAILFGKSRNTVRWIALVGSVIQFALAIYLYVAFMDARHAGDFSPFLFTDGYIWYQPLQLNYHIGVDGISVAMILLTAFVVLAGVLVSWKQEHLYKEFFLMLIVLGAGAYGFFIALDLFTMFFFLEIAVIPKFLLIGIWGSGKKVQAALKLALMLMGGSALIFVGLIGLYFFGDHNLDIYHLGNV